ncbi:hypothetical protein BpHYR1_015934 [Brachionus plicatilis]|uniref:Uncharacterized protein n=1 Tax=Brachionus plicatilis TaxID=10195 RepID=A0A3M7S5U0_BRAPC|nr:hypothetical protein BpHYR1_015934 [Brachionus plicatilis]
MSVTTLDYQAVDAEHKQKTCDLINGKENRSILSQMLASIASYATGCARLDSNRSIGHSEKKSLIWLKRLEKRET